MRIVVIGGRGHIGTFLVPRLVRAGHEVVNVSRGRSAAYSSAPEWDDVRQVDADREAEDAAGTFGERVAGLEADAVVDLISFTTGSTATLVDALRGRTGHLLHCGSLWRYGPSRWAPIREGDPTDPVGEYGIGKDAIARLLADETAAGGLATTSLHPGHIVGPGWTPIGPTGNLDHEVWRTIAAGRPVLVPGLGAETVNHVHADDVAQCFEAAVERRDAVAGEDVNVVAATALNVRGYLGLAASWFGQEAALEHVSWDEFRAGTSPEHADASWEHLYRSHCLSIDKARELLGYAPAYEPGEAILESVRWLVDHGELEVGSPLVV